MLGLRFHAAASGVSAAGRLFEILSAPLPVSEAVPLAAPTLWQAVTFSDVRVAFPGGRSALRGATFQIPAGQKTALVGPSGAGKSTVAQLLLCFVDPEQGEICVDGQPLSRLACAAWRERIAWVPQSPYLFHDTVAANLRLARPRATDADLVQATRRACLHDDIAALPDGYSTVVGEKGERLSAGQAQRLALARAFLKDAPFLIMDEPTSRVDPELEAQLQQAADGLMRGRTTLVIAHRLNTVYQADQIVVLADGQVVERGRHGELLRQRGPYYQLLTAGIP